MFKIHYNASLIIDESTITSLLLYKKNKKWQLILASRYTVFINPCDPIPSDEFLQPLLTIEQLLSNYRCSIRLMVAKLPIFNTSLTCSANMLSPSILNKIALHCAMQKSGGSHDAISIDYRLTNQLKTLNIIWCCQQTIMQWQSILKTCGIHLDIFESEDTLNKQCQLRYPIIKNNIAYSALKWSDFHIIAPPDTIHIDENIILAIGLATRPRDTLCC